MAEYLHLLAAHASPTLLVGVKLPPFTYQGEEKNRDARNVQPGMYLIPSRVLRR